MESRDLRSMINGHSSDREGVTFGDLTRSRELADEEESSEDKCLVHVERHPNGGATVVHLYEEEVAHLPSSRVHGLADVFFRYTLQTVAGCVSCPLPSQGGVPGVFPWGPESCDGYRPWRSLPPT